MCVVYGPEGVLEIGRYRWMGDDDVDSGTVYHTADSFEIGELYIHESSSVNILLALFSPPSPARRLSLPLDIHVTV